MVSRRFILETVTLVVVALACAVISNVVSSKEKKVKFVGSYPSALTVPEHVEGPMVIGVPHDTVTTPPVTSTATPLTTTSTQPVPATQTTTTAAPGKPVATPAATTTAAPAAPKADPAAEMLKRFPPHPNTQYTEISDADAKWLHDRGALFLDARRTNVYEEGHIAGARSFPVWESEIDDRVAQLVNENRNTNLPVVVYCSGGDCEDSHMLAERLFGVFFANILVYKNGYPGWQKIGGPIRTGAQP